MRYNYGMKFIDKLEEIVVTLGIYFLICGVMSLVLMIINERISPYFNSFEQIVISFLMTTLFKVKVFKIDKKLNIFLDRRFQINFFTSLGTQEH